MNISTFAGVAINKIHTTYLQYLPGWVNFDGCGNISYCIKVLLLHPKKIEDTN
jgi:hypothetical protein